MADKKAYLRALLKEARESIPVERARALSARVQARLLAGAPYQGAAAVVLYAGHDNEVATELIMADALRSHRALYFPRLCAGGRGAMELARVRDPAELVPGAFGILEPAGPREAGALQSALICVPGVAFSVDGRRLGRGGGHYDRMLAGAGGGVVTAGLAYSFQVLDTLPESPHDRRLDFVVTQSTVFSAAGEWRARVDDGGKFRCLQ